MSSKNCRKLSHEKKYLIICFLGFGSKKYYFFHKIVRKQSQKWLKFRKNYLTKKLFNYLLFGRFSKQLVEEMESTSDQFFTNPQKVSQKTKKK